VRITGVIEDQAVRFTRRQAQAAADDLLVKAHRLGRAQDGDQIDMRRIKAGRQYRDVHQIAILLSFKRFNDAIALGPGVSPVIKAASPCGSNPVTSRACSTVAAKIITLCAFGRIQRFG
jgi:hypothetical protein